MSNWDADSVVGRLLSRLKQQEHACRAMARSHPNWCFFQHQVLSGNRNCLYGKSLYLMDRGWALSPRSREPVFATVAEYLATWHNPLQAAENALRAIGGPQ